MRVHPQDSALWHVLASPLALGKANSAYIAYTLVVFGYLAAPLAGQIAQQAGEGLADFMRARGGVWAWRF